MRIKETDGRHADWCRFINSLCGCSELRHPIPPSTFSSRSAHRIALWGKTSYRNGSREDVYWSDGWNVGWIILLDRLILKWGTFKRLLICSCPSASPIRVCVSWLLEFLSAKQLLEWERNKVIRTGGACCEHVKFDLKKKGSWDRLKSSKLLDDLPNENFCSFSHRSFSEEVRHWCQAQRHAAQSVF